LVPGFSNQILAYLLWTFLRYYYYDLDYFDFPKIHQQEKSGIICKKSKDFNSACSLISFYGDFAFDLAGCKTCYRYSDTMGFIFDTSNAFYVFLLDFSIDKNDVKNSSFLIKILFIN